MMHQIGTARACLCAVLYVLLASAGFPQAENLKVEATAGFDGYYRPGQWVPVFVSVTNQASSGGNTSDDFRGQLMVVSQPDESSAPPLRYLREIHVPASSSKRYVVFAKFRSDLATPPELLLNLENGKTVGRYPLNVQSIPPEGVLMVNVSDSFAAPGFPRVRNQIDPTLSAKLPPALLSDHWACYDSADIVVFPGWPARGIRPEQIQALTEWASMGGTLIFLGGQDTATYVEDAAKELLPVVLSGTGRLVEGEGGAISVTREVAKPGDSARSFVVSLAAPKADAEVLLQVDNNPLVVTRNIGNGRAIFFANDFQGGSTGMEALIGPPWWSIQPLPNIADAHYEFPEALTSLKTLTGRAARPPNQFVIILICVLYTLVVGPINFAILGKKKKLELAWFTVPVIVMVFFFLMYGMGRLMKGGDNIVREIELREFRGGDPLGRTLAITGTFSSDEGRYSLRPSTNHQTIGDSYRWAALDEFRTGAEFSAGNPFGQVTKLPTASSPVFAFDARTSNIYIQSWTMGTYDANTFLSRGPAKMEGTIDADLVWSGLSVRGKIVNNSGVDYQKAWLLVGDDLYALNALAKGETREIGGGAIRAQEARLIFNSQVVSSPANDSELNMNNFGVVMEALQRPRRSGSFLPPRSGEIVLLALNEEPLPKAVSQSLEMSVGSRLSLTMVRFDAPPPSDTAFEVTNRHMVKRLHNFDIPAGGTFAVDSDGRLQMMNSAGIFSMELPFHDPDVTITSVAIFPNVPKVLPNQDMALQIYQFGGGWVDVKPNTEMRNDSLALPMSGRIYLRMISQDNKKPAQIGWNEKCLVSDLGVVMKGVRR